MDQINIIGTAVSYMNGSAPMYAVYVFMMQYQITKKVLAVFFPKNKPVKTAITYLVV